MMIAHEREGITVVAVSATLAINERLQARHDAGVGAGDLRLGFGEAGLPVLPEVADLLARASRANGYGPVAGSSTARRAAAGWFGRRGLPTDPDQIVLGPGSKSLLYAIVATLPGAVVLPTPSWVSYAAQAALAGKPVLRVPVPEAGGGVPDPDLLDDALHRALPGGARRGGPAADEPGILVLTVPDNPTGTVADPGLVEKVCAVADRHGLVVVADEIYRDLAYDPAAVASPASFVPERCFVTTGLSKSMALGGWRIGCARFPAGELGERTRARVLGLASEVWSSMARPMLDVVTYVMDEPPEVTAYVDAGRRLHQRVSRAVHAELVAAGARCRPPGAAFYLYPDLGARREALARRGVATGAELADHLLDTHGVGVLPGEAFGDDPAALRFRVATALLYGRSDGERWTALHAPDPLALPWIAGALATLRHALATTLSSPG
jgi:aspartate aminotransferase